MADHSGLSVWVVDPLVKVLPDARPPDSAGSTVRIDAARNEYESGQIAVRAGSRIESLSVRVGPVTGPAGSKPQIEAQFVGFVPVKRGTTEPPEKVVARAPADIPDPLLDARSVSVEAERTQPVWLTVHVPKSTNPGAYRGSVEIVADGVAHPVELEIRVHPVTVPDERTLYVTNWFDFGKLGPRKAIRQWTAANWKMLENYAEVMARYRQNVVITPLFELIRFGDDGTGKLSFGFEQFDRWVETFIEAGAVGYIEGGHLGGRSDWLATDFNATVPLIFGPDGSPRAGKPMTVSSEEYGQFLSQFLPGLVGHLRNKGWLDIYIQHLCDEPIKENAESYRKLSSYVRQYAPELRIMDACMCSELVGALDVWVPQPPHYADDIEFFRERQKSGDEVWFYTCLSPKGKYMNRFIDYPLIDTRLLHWVNYKYDLTGYLHWGFNHWQGDPFVDLEPNWGGDNYLPPGDSHIVYPGRRGLLSSIRLEAMRDGIEDYELLKMLDRKSPARAKAICDSVVTSLKEYVLDPAEFRRARAKLIEALAE